MLTISITIESAISPTYNWYLCMLLQACSTGAICSDSTHSSFVIASISCSEGQLQGMIKRWPTYRLHSEIQLIVFYEMLMSSIAYVLNFNQLCVRSRPTNLLPF